MEGMLGSKLFGVLQRPSVISRLVCYLEKVPFSTERTAPVVQRRTHIQHEETIRAVQQCRPSAKEAGSVRRREY